MEQLGGRIRKLRESRNMTQTELSEILGMKTYTTVSKWEKNENFPKGKDLKKLAEIFNVTSDYLLGLSDTKLGKITTQNEHPEILTIYNQLEEPKQEKVLSYAKDQLEEQESSNIISIFNKSQNDDYITDYVEGLVAAGHGTFQEDNLHMEVRLRAEDIPEDYDTIAKVAGDSMEPMIEDNDLLFIRGTNQVDINDIGIFQINGKNFVKKLKRDYNGGWYLQSLNNSYEEIHLTENDDIRTIGEVVSVYREK
jgi:transcriptional regulator, cro/CI family|nr:MAG TPA: Repressor protein CI [Caudoviricetes sp.]